MPGTDEDGYAAAAFDSKGISPGVEALTDDCRFSGIGGDHPGAISRGAAVPAQAGFDINYWLMKDYLLNFGVRIFHGLVSFELAKGLDLASCKHSFFLLMDVIIGYCNPQPSSTEKIR